MYNFLDKLGLKTLLEAIKSKFPASLPANGGNADTVDGLHSTSFVSRLTTIPVSDSWIAYPAVIDENGVWVYREYVRKTADGIAVNKLWRASTPDGSKYNQLAVSCEENYAVWNFYGTVEAILRVNGANVYNTNFKPFVTGTVTSNGGTCITNHRFSPSLVLFSISSPDSSPLYCHVFRAASADSVSFTLGIELDPDTDHTINYIIFR